MTDADQPEFLSVINQLCGWYRTEPTEMLIDGFWNGLKALSLAEVKAAIGQCITTEKFLPMPAVILEKARGSERSEAQEAWDHVRREVARVGWCGTPRLTEAQRHALGAVGGWQRLCESDTTAVDFMGKDFRESYANAVRREKQQRALDAISAPPRPELPPARADHRGDRKNAATGEPESVAAIWGRMGATSGGDR